MTGAKSIYFDKETEDIINEFMETNHHANFSQATRAMVCLYNVQMKAVAAYRDEIAVLHKKIEEINGKGE